MKNFIFDICAFAITTLSQALRLIFIDLTVTGRENLPDKSHGPLIVVANHLSVFEAPLMHIILPYKMIFIAGAELNYSPIYTFLIKIYHAIPIQRGSVDRKALKQARNVLKNGGVLGIFPEGGIDPDHVANLAHGRDSDTATAPSVRESGALIPPRPGAVYLATNTGAKILPVAFINTEKVQNNLQRYKRTKVEMRIGPVFGPLTLPPDARGADKRQALNACSEEMMRHIAALLPPERRGPYQ